MGEVTAVSIGDNCKNPGRMFLGFQRDLIGFEAEIEVPSLEDGAEVSVVVDRPREILLMRALVGDIPRRDPFVGRADAV